MRLVAVACFVALAACAPPKAPQGDTTSPRQQPSVTAPGVNVSGSVEFGVKRGL